MVEGAGVFVNFVDEFVVGFLVYVCGVYVVANQDAEVDGLFGKGHVRPCAVLN